MFMYVCLSMSRRLTSWLSCLCLSVSVRICLCVSLCFYLWIFRIAHYQVAMIMSKEHFKFTIQFISCNTFFPLTLNIMNNIYMLRYLLSIYKYLWISLFFNSWHQNWIILHEIIWTCVNWNCTIYRVDTF